MATRRQFIAGIGAGIGASLLLPKSRACFASEDEKRRQTKKLPRVLVLGMDGVDPSLLKKFMALGELPNFSRLAERAYFGKLGTTMPPQSPVAWASFISGCKPGRHGIFDFIHRDPQKFEPYLSISKSVASSNKISLAGYELPLSSGKVLNMRQGPAFWDYLSDKGIPTTIFQVPSNFPVSNSKTEQISGMGTPDLIGSYGTFTLVSELAVEGSEHFTSGRLVLCRPKNHRYQFSIKGPAHPFKTAKTTEVPVVAIRDPWEKSLLFEIGGQKVILTEGEWSDWLPLRFSLSPSFSSLAGMCRIFVKSVHPYLQLYISPVNIDPLEPALPITSPSSFSSEIANACGRFYTQGLPADTKALAHGALSNEEYFGQAKLIIEENLRALEYLLSRFDEGLLFFYFSSIDQNCHMLWRLMDENHPLYEKNASPELKKAVLYFYKKMDQALGLALSKIDSNTTLMVLSDHGFNTFTREVHLNDLLRKHGFLTLADEKKALEGEFFTAVDWEKTKAYGLGFNGIYLNLKDRDLHGSVQQKDVPAVIDEIRRALGPTLDEERGTPCFRNLYDGREIYQGEHSYLAPDIAVGYTPSYRVSDESALGGFSETIFTNRTNKWSADHCFDNETVPGILISTRELKNSTHHIWDLAPSILEVFGIAAPAGVFDGSSILT